MSFLNRRDTAILFGVLCLIFQLGILCILLPVDTSLHLLTHQITLSRSEFAALTISWGEAGRERFLWHYALDFFYPLSYGIFLASLIVQLTPFRQRPWYRFWLALPLVAAGMDELENICQLLLVKGTLPLSSPLFYVGALSARAKWSLLALTSFALLAGVYEKLSSTRRPL